MIVFILKRFQHFRVFFSLIFLEWREKRVLQDWNGVSLITWCYSINRNYMDFPQTHVSVLCWIAFSPFLASKNNNSVSNMWKKVITFFINVLLSTDFSKLFRVATFFSHQKYDFMTRAYMYLLSGFFFNVFWYNIYKVDILRNA